MLFINKRIFGVLALAGMLVGCTPAAPTAQPALSLTPAASSKPAQTLAPSRARTGEIEAIHAMGTILGLPELPLEFVETTTMINSPNGDLAVALYQDAEGRKYSVEPEKDLVVEIDARAVPSAIASDALPLSQDELRAKAEKLVRRAIPDFDSMQAGLSYEEGVKGDYFFFTWRAADSPGSMNRPFAQIGLHRSGELFAYYNTLTLSEGAGATIIETPGLPRGMGQAIGCSTVKRLETDSPEGQQIVDESVSNYKEQYPTEYMGMAILHRVDRLGEWAVVTGSIAGEGKDVIAVRQTSQGYQIAEFIHIVPLESPEELEMRVIQPLLERLPEAPPALFTCLDQAWLLASGYPSVSSNVYQLAYVGTSDYTTEGVTEIHSLQSDGSNQTTILSEPMLIMNPVSSPDGEKIAFWGCPGGLANDCSAGEDLDVWVVNWDGSNLRNLTEDSAANDSHPDWSPDGQQVVFDSDRLGDSQLYVMNADGSAPRALTGNPGRNAEPKWSPDGKWIAYHCTEASETGIETRICVISPDGQPAGEPIAGTTPAWSPGGLEDGTGLAFLCFQEGHSDICTARPDGSELANLTNSPADEHSLAWSPDGNWLAFVSNRGEDVDIYKVCVTCPGETVALRLTDEPRAAGWPAWSPDGGQVAYVDMGGQDLLVVNADRSDATYLASGVFGPPIWRPSGPYPVSMAAQETAIQYFRAMDAGDYAEAYRFRHPDKLYGKTESVFVANQEASGLNSMKLLSIQPLNDWLEAQPPDYHRGAPLVETDRCKQFVVELNVAYLPGHMGAEPGGIENKVVAMVFDQARWWVMEIGTLPDPTYCERIGR
jgi:Tol biopolymer transport system component